MKTLKGMMLSLAMLGTFAVAAAAPTVTITKAQQRYPWNDKIDVDYSITHDKSRQFYLKFLLIDGAVTNSVKTDVNVLPTDETTSLSGRYTIDVPTQAADFDEKLNAGGIQIIAVLSDQGMPDWGDGTTFVAQDYLVLDLVNGTVEPLLNVTAPEQYNTDDYKKTAMIFRRVPAGSFRMGATDSVNRAFTTGTLTTLETDYYIAVFPCTQAQYTTVNSGAVAGSKGSNLPQASISWNTITGTFIPKLDTLMGDARAYQVALPTAAQWERAARAGTTTEWFFGASSSALGQYAWFGTSSTQAVGLLKPNGWGLYDVYGNVWEWTATASGSYRIYRGGGYSDGASGCSSVGSDSYDPSDAYDGVGFRLIMTLK